MSYAADIRMNNNNPLNRRGSVEKAITNKTKTVMSLGVNSYLWCENTKRRYRNFSRESILTLNHSLFKNLDLGLSYIYNEETSRNNTENRTDSLKSSNISLGAKYQFLDTRFLSSAISSYVESGYGDISSSTSSSKSKVGASGLVSIYAGTNFLVNLEYWIQTLQ